MSFETCGPWGFSVCYPTSSKNPPFRTLKLSRFCTFLLRYNVNLKSLKVGPLAIREFYEKGPLRGITPSPFSNNTKTPLGVK